MEQQGDRRTWRQKNRDKQCEKESMSQRERHTQSLGDTEMQRDLESRHTHTQMHKQTDRRTDTEKGETGSH